METHQQAETPWGITDYAKCAFVCVFGPLFIYSSVRSAAVGVCLVVAGIWVMGQYAFSLLS